TLPFGTPDDPADAQTVCGLGNRKNLLFRKLLERDGVTPFPGVREILAGLKEAAVEVAVVSSSRNARLVQNAAGLTDEFELVVDGITSEEQHLSSKPAPDPFLYAAEKLGAAPARTIVIEDAISGIESGHSGGFGLVVG